MRWVIGGVIVVAVLAAGIAYAIGLVGFERHQGYYAPVFAPDGSAVYYIQRDTTGVAWGLGWQGFSAPAYANATSDVVSLRRLTLADGRIDVLEEWRDSPVLGRTLRTYRPGLFQYLYVRLRMETPDAVDYAMKLSITQVPRSIPFGIEGVWSDNPALANRGEWRDGGASMGGYSRWSLHGSVELFSVRAYGAHPPALLAYDHDTGETNAALRGHFDSFVESAVEGLRKPDPRIYELICARLGVTPSETAFLDDIGANLKPARAMGMTTIRVVEPESALAELETHLGFPLA